MTVGGRARTAPLIAEAERGRLLHANAPKLVGRRIEHRQNLGNTGVTPMLIDPRCSSFVRYHTFGRRLSDPRNKKEPIAARGLARFSRHGSIRSKAMSKT